MTPRDLKEQFKIETSRSIINDKGCHDIDYVHWLEDKIVKNCFIPDVINRRELLLAFLQYLDKDKPLSWFTHEPILNNFLSKQSRLYIHKNCTIHDSNTERKAQAE